MTTYTETEKKQLLEAFWKMLDEGYDTCTYETTELDFPGIIRKIYAIRIKKYDERKEI